jgi:two-component system, chemotaxis family, chemotaxis protein CheY
MKTLIVDDAGFMRELLAQHCHELGHQIIAEATTGTEAIELAKKLNPELIIMDMVLPEKNGLEAASEIIQENSATEILAITSLDEPWIQSKLETAGFKYFLKKPFTKSELQSVLNSIQKERRSLKHG